MAKVDAHKLALTKKKLSWMRSLYIILWCLFPDKLAFVGFKGSFRPDWVRMSIDEERAKLHQVLPIPVIKMMKLWRRATHAAGHLRLPDDPSYSRTPGLLNLKHQSQPSMCLLPRNPSQRIPLYVTTWTLWFLDRVVSWLYLSFYGRKTRKN